MATFSQSKLNVWLKLEIYTLLSNDLSTIRNIFVKFNLIVRQICNNLLNIGNFAFLTQILNNALFYLRFVVWTTTIQTSLLSLHVSLRQVVIEQHL